MLPNSTKILLLKIPYASSRQKAKWEEYLNAIRNVSNSTKILLLKIPYASSRQKRSIKRQ